jgi:outer membrane receptor for ferrienterochelin and colicin
MSFRRTALALTVVLLSAGIAAAQSTTGTISGRVSDSQERAVPGVTVTVESPNLQGVRTSVTSETGDYVVTLLPSGTYTVSFELSGFERQQRTVRLAPTQVQVVDATLGIAAMEETVNVVGQSADVLMRTARVATNFSQGLISALPTTRDINATLLMAPSVHATGPGGAYSIAGSMSYENLFLINGVTVNENLRGQAYDLYIEDAVQETTVASAGISAEYGRFGGGVVNIITKSGGNTFGGSFRDTINNDNWRALTPFAGDTKADKLLSAYEYTLGGPVLRDRLWFFTAGRVQNTAEGRTLFNTNLPYEFTNALRRYEGKATFSVRNQRFEGAYTRSSEDQENSAAGNVMDERSLFDPNRVMDLLTVGYTAVVSPQLFVEARFSTRNETLKNVGAPTTDLIDGTLILDATNARRYWSPTFCGVCDPEERDNQDIFLKGSYFLSKDAYGSHNFSFGYDNFNDRRFANNRQSGSDFRLYATRSIVDGPTVTPVFISNQTIIQWNPIVIDTEGTNFRMHSLFVNDAWRAAPTLTFNLGLRYDKNHGSNGAGQVVARDSAFSPRVGVVWDPVGDARWTIAGSFAQYVAAISNTIADSSSAAGNSDNYPYVYSGPSINANGVVETPAAEAIRQVFDWFEANGGTNQPLNGGFLGIPTTVRGVTPLIRESLTSPNVLEYATGVSRQFGNRASVRADFIYRNYRDFYAARTDMSTGQVRDKLDRPFDLTVIENTDALKRRYAGLSTQATYRAGSRFDFGMTYTLSRAWGNIDGESATGGPGTDAGLQYPEYKEASWNYPMGDLAIDQRHRARLWATYALPQLPNLLVSVLQTLESGVPYGAVGNVATRSFVTDPGYLSEPGSVPYYYTARDRFRTEGQKRTDLAVNYTHRMPSLGRLELFGQMQVINLFNQFQLCGCGQAVTQSGGAVNSTRIDQTVRTAVSAPTVFQAFNPFTDTPVEGTNWALGPAFGTALNRLAYTSPRAVRFSFGVRF